MATISLAKALKLKNRLAGRLARVNADVQTYNSVLKENEGRIDVAALVKESRELVEALSDLKERIQTANVPILRRLIDLGEKKAEIEFLQLIPTRHGRERHGYQNTDVEYVAFLTKEEVDRQVRQLEAEIDQLQESVEDFNYGTKIEIPQRSLDLAS